MEGIIFVLFFSFYYANGLIPYLTNMSVTKGDSFIVKCGITYEETFGWCYIENSKGARLTYARNPKWQMEDWEKHGMMDELISLTTQQCAGWK